MRRQIRIGTLLVLGTLFTLNLFGGEAKAQYKLYWIRCSERVWRPFGITPQSYGVNPNNYAQMVNLANRLSSSTQKLGVGTSTRYPTTNPCGGSSGGGGGGGSGGGGSGGCYGSVNNPFFMIARRTYAGFQYYNNIKYCSLTSSRNAYFANYIYLRNNGFDIFSGTLTWNSCGPTFYACRGGVVVTVPNYSSSSGWATN